MTEQEIIAIIENYLANNLQKTKVSQLPQAASLDNLQILGVSGSQSVRAAMSLLKGLDGKNPELRKTDTHIQWRVTDGTWADLIALNDLKGLKILLEKSGDVVNYKYEGDANWQLLFSLADLAGDNAYEVAVKNGFVGTETQWLSSLKGEPFKYSDFTPQQLESLKGAKGDEISLQITSTHIQWRLGTGSWNNLIALADLEGEKGNPGATIELQKTSTHIQWRVVGTSTWNNLATLEELKVKGDTGASIELQVTATYIQWRVQGTTTWSNLIALSELKGATGSNIELQKTTTYIQWRVAGGSWANLVALADLKGDPGQGLPAGGSAGQQLVKKSATNYDYDWQTPAGAGDMLKSVYDPSNKNGDAFSQDNMKDGTTNKNFTTTDRDNIAEKYIKPASGIPKSDLETAVQTSLGKADTALQSYTETDPTIPAWAKQAQKPTYTATEVGALPSAHNADGSAHADIRSEVAAVRLIAEGAAVGYAFDTVAAMNSWLAVAANKEKLQVGNSLFIRALDVPDYWWDGTQAMQLETAKVDLSGYLLSSVAANTYVAKETGKSLMTDAERTKLNGISEGSQKNSDITKAEIEARLTNAVNSHYHEGGSFSNAVLDLTRTSGMYRVVSASSSTSYTLSTTKIIGAWCKVLINAVTEPTINGGSKIKGSDFRPNTNMYLLAQYDGTKTEYYFAEI